jgi:hypothetical protein
MTRDEARLLGLKTYDTGKPCKKGHTPIRYVTNSGCVECLRVRNIDRYAKNRDVQYAAWRKWYEANKDVHAVRVKRWQQNNKEIVKLTAKQWQKNNPEKVKQKHLRYRQKHPDAYTARAVASVANRAKRTPKWLTSEDRWLMRQAYALAKLRTKMLGFVWEVDHIIPLRGATVSGLHVPDNLQVIPKVVNREKRNYFA